jgi:hypothetical protein
LHNVSVRVCAAAVSARTGKSVPGHNLPELVCS